MLSASVLSCSSCPITWLAQRLERRLIARLCNRPLATCGKNASRPSWGATATRPSWRPPRWRWAAWSPAKTCSPAARWRRSGRKKSARVHRPLQDRSTCAARARNWLRQQPAGQHDDLVPGEGEDVQTPAVYPQELEQRLVGFSREALRPWTDVETSLEQKVEINFGWDGSGRSGFS